ncbi:MAG: SDR family oxidoreductase [Desulfurococcales archaeon]|nr:SDR family oxidoreductase [Desulfurococcales archaeon]
MTQGSSQWAIVTGASKGLGYHTAKALAEEGFNLVLFSRNKQRLVKTIEVLRSRKGEITVIGVPGDLRNPEDIDRLFEETYKYTGKVDYLFISYGNPLCEPSKIPDVPWSCWLEATSLYLASTHRILQNLISSNNVRTRVLVFNSFTITSPGHELLTVADAVRRGLSLLLKRTAYSYPSKLMIIEARFGSMKTPGAIETIRLVSRLQRIEPDEMWIIIREKMTPLNRLASYDDILALVKTVVSMPDYTVYTVLNIDGGSDSIVC